MSELDALIESGDDYEEPETVEQESEVEEVETEEVETEETEEVEESATTAQDRGKKAKSNDEEEETHWTKAAYLDEKRKRQELEKRLAELDKPRQQEESIDLLTDPEAGARLLEQRAENKAFLRVIELSRDVMRDAKPDYDEMESYFVEQAKADPSLVDKMRVAANPAKYAYDTAKRLKFLAEVNDPEAYKAKLRAEILQELQAEQVKKKPASLTKTTSAGGTKAVTGDDSLESILGR